MDLILPNLLSDDPKQITFSLQASVSFPLLLHSPHTHTHTHTHTESTWGQSCRSCLKGGPCMHHPQVPCQFWSSSTFFSLFPESFCFHDLLTLVHYIHLIPVFVQLQTWRGKTGEKPLCWAPTSSANQSLLVKTPIVSGNLKSPVNSCCGL